MLPPGGEHGQTRRYHGLAKAVLVMASDDWAEVKLVEGLDTLGKLDDHKAWSNGMLHHHVWFSWALSEHHRPIFGGNLPRTMNGTLQRPDWR